MTDGSGAAETLRRLERRLQRERAARLEAEDIAEKGLRELYERKRHLRLLETIAAAANESVSIKETLLYVLRVVCEFTGWPLGHALLAGEEDGRVVVSSAGLWHAEGDHDYGDFRKLSEAGRFTAGAGLPGRVMASGAAVWISEVTLDPNFPRAPLARACGLRAAFAFPVMVGTEVAGVLEFFSESRLDPDAELLHAVTQIGAQLGRVIERSRAEQQLRDHNTELTRLIAEADAQRDAAEAASRAKSAFLAVTSHEIRTPLNAVLGMAEALRREPLTPRQLDLATGVLDGGTMLLRLLNAVLDMSKIEAGKMVLAAEPFDPRKTVRRVAGVWTARMEELGVVLALDLSGLPDGCRLVTDEGKVEQTLINLVSNAAKFSPPGGTITVRLSARRARGGWRARVEVIDQGPGVAADDRMRIFQPYEQTPRGREAGGAGLGLSICAGNVALLGGVIDADRTEAGESRFWFDFPAKGAQGLEPAPVPQAVVPMHTRSLRVLVAEDNAANREVMRVLLEPAGVELGFAEDGAQAVEAVQTGAYDLILMDANMPVMDGVAAVRRIRSLDGARALVPIHMVTANVFDDDIARYHAAGADGVLKKPIDLAALYAVLEAAFEAEAAAA